MILCIYVQTYNIILTKKADVPIEQFKISIIKLITKALGYNVKKKYIFA